MRKPSHHRSPRHWRRGAGASRCCWRRRERGTGVVPVERLGRHAVAAVDDTTGATAAAGERRAPLRGGVRLPGSPAEPGRAAPNRARLLRQLVEDREHAALRGLFRAED